MDKGKAMGTKTNSWGIHISNKVLLEIKITDEKMYTFDQEFGLP